MRAALVAAAVAGVAALGGAARAQPAHLAPGDVPAAGDEPPQILLLTFGVGPRIFEKFGHAAICVKHPSSAREPVCWNFGVTNFEGGAGMAWRFLRGEQKFWVEAETWSATLGFYRREDRDIFVQDLPLAPDQARAVEAELIADLDETRRFYVYDHFYDNCTTRLRDLIDRASGGALHAGADAPYPLTFRAMGHSGLSEFPWMTALADFVLGRQLDDTPSLWEAMFHPEVLRRVVEDRLHAAPRVIYKRHGAPFPTDGPTDRALALVLGLAFAVPLALARWRRRFERAALVWATIYLALCGLVIWSLAVLSAIPGVRWNEAVFVMMPLDAVLPFLAAERRRTYARARLVGLLAVSLLCAIGVFHQPLWIPIATAFAPLALIGL